MIFVIPQAFSIYITPVTLETGTQIGTNSLLVSIVAHGIG